MERRVNITTVFQNNICKSHDASSVTHCNNLLGAYCDASDFSYYRNPCHRIPPAEVNVSQWNLILSYWDTFCTVSPGPPGDSVWQWQTLHVKRKSPMRYGNSQWNELKNAPTKKPDAKQYVFKFGLEICAFRMKSNKLNWWSHLCGIMAEEASSRTDHPNMSTVILSFSKCTLQIL